MEASRLYYAFDIAPGFWTWLKIAITTGDVASVTAVKDEITAGKDPLVQWAARGATVVTRERPEPQSKKRVKIPDACAAHGVPWIDPFTTYRRLGLRLVS